MVIDMLLFFFKHYHQIIRKLLLFFLLVNFLVCFTIIILINYTKSLELVVYNFRFQKKLNAVKLLYNDCESML